MIKKDKKSKTSEKSLSKKPSVPKLNLKHESSKSKNRTVRLPAINTIDTYTPKHKQKDDSLPSIIMSTSRLSVNSITSPRYSKRVLPKLNEQIKCSHSTIDIRDPELSSELRVGNSQLSQKSQKAFMANSVFKDISEVSKGHLSGHIIESTISPEISTISNYESQMIQKTFRREDSFDFPSQISHRKSPKFANVESESEALNPLERDVKETKHKVKNLNVLHKAMCRHIKSQRDRIKILEKYCLKLNTRYQKEVDSIKEMVQQMKQQTDRAGKEPSLNKDQSHPSLTARRHNEPNFNQNTSKCCNIF
jgi:hypothetical protein